MVNWYGEVLKRREELLEDLFGLLKIESVKDESTKSKDHPMGKKVGEALQYMLSLSEKDQFQTKNVDGYAGHIQYGNFSEEETIGILCHVDVVPATGDWTSPPFEPTIRGGKLFARGAIDDKGPTMAAYYGLKIIKELGLATNKNVRIIVGTDEESGMSCLRYYREVERMPSIGFAPDADFPIINAEKGQINVKFELRSHITPSAGSITLKSFTSGSRINMVPETAVVVLNGRTEDLVNDFKEYCEVHNLTYAVNPKGSGTELTLYGVSAHGMEPHIGKNAGTMLAIFLQKYELNDEANTYIQFLCNLHEDYKGENLSISFYDEVTGPLTVNPGLLSYEEDGGKSVSLNIRVPVTTDYESIKTRLKATAQENGFEISEIRESNPHHVDANHPFIKALQNSYESETNLEPTLLSTGGATYARFMEYGVAFGACFPGKEMTAHQKDEYIEIDDLMKATAIYARAIYELIK